MHVTEHRLGFVELALALEVEPETIEVLEQRFRQRYLAELVPRQVELSLALVREPEHAVRLGRALVGPELGALGDDEALRHERGMADEQERRRQHQLDPGARGQHQAGLADEQRREDCARDRKRRARLEPWQQCRQIQRDQRDHQPLRERGPCRHHEEVLLQDRGHRICQRQHRCHRRRHRRDHGRADARRGGADEHDLVGVLARRDLAIQHVVERVDLEGGAAVAILVEEAAHLQRRIGGDAQAAERHALAQAQLDIGGRKIQAARRDHHRERRVVLVEVLQHQRLGAHRAIHVRVRVEVAQASGGLADRLDRHLHAHRGERRELRIALGGDGILLHECRQRTVGLAERLAEREEHWQQHAACSRIATLEHAIGIEALLGVLQRGEEARQFRRRAGRALGRRLLGQLDQLDDGGVARVDLRLAEKQGVADHLGLRAGKKIGHARMDIARPRPAPDIGDAGVVDGDCRVRLNCKLL